MSDLWSGKIIAHLQQQQLVTPEQLQQLEAKTKNGSKSLEEVIVGEKILTAYRFAEIKGQLANLTVADLSEVAVPAEVLNILSQKVAQNYQMVIFGREGNEIKVGLVNPDNFQAHEAIEFLSQQQGLSVKYFVITLGDFKQVLKQYSGFKKELGTAIEVAQEKFAPKELELSQQSSDIEEVVKTAPVAKIVSVIIKHAIDGGASDIHIEPGINESRVRYRVDGQLHTSLTLPPYLHTAVISRIKVLANLKIDETRLPQDGRIRIKLDTQEVDLRVSVLPMLTAEKIVMRVLDNSAGVPNLTELGYKKYHTDIIDRNIHKPFGLFLLTGPTGSGKTTTLYSILNMLNGDDSNITTLEDPIEYYMTGVNQSQINPEIDYTFAHGLRAILRQDPNIIMVGEIRDAETVELVIHAGLTGHLVFSTLHTNDAWGAIPRLIDMHAEAFLLSSTLNLVMAQRLVRKICPDCRKPIVLPPAVAERIKAEVANIPPEYLQGVTGEQKFYHGKGCSSCSNTGYMGRSVVGEILEMGPELKAIIARGFDMETVTKQLQKQKYITLMQDGLIKALEGITTVEEVLRVAQK